MSYDELSKNFSTQKRTKKENQVLSKVTGEKTPQLGAKQQRKTGGRKNIYQMPARREQPLESAARVS